MMKKLYWKLTICLALFAAVATYFIRNDEEEYVFKSFFLHDNYRVELKTSKSLDIARPIYCVVLKSGEVVFGKQLIGATSSDIDSLSFAVIKVNNIFGIVENSNPNIVLAIYDLKNNKSFPTTSRSEAKSDAYKFGKKLINTLNDDKLAEYVLSYEVPGNIDLKVR